MFEFIDPSGSTVCNNVTVDLYHDYDLTEPYLQKENSTIQLVIEGEAQEILIHTS
jgi:hypothetical protein